MIAECKNCGAKYQVKTDRKPSRSYFPKPIYCPYCRGRDLSVIWND